MEEIIIAAAVAIVLSTIKNPSKKAKLRKVLLKIHNAIKQAYLDDPDFA